MKNIKRYVSVVIIASLLSGCNASTHKEETVELLEPIILTENYRPVRYSIGDQKTIWGKVGYVEYGQVYGSNKIIAEVIVQPGDMVKAGDRLAIADTSEAQNMLTECRAELDRLNKSFELKAEIARQQIEKLKLSGDARAELEISIINENQSYESVLHENEVDSIRKKIASLEEEISGNELFADRDGMVVYVKNLADFTAAEGNENIVVIADINEKCIFLQNTTVDQYIDYRDAEFKYVSHNNEKIEVTEKDYTTRELLTLKQEGKSPSMRLTSERIDEFELGEDVVVEYLMKDTRNILEVDNSSVHNDDGDYVYVHVNGKKEKRQVKLGESNKKSTQILEGLEENELVYLNSEDIIPTKYIEYEVQINNYQVVNTTLEKALSKSYVYSYVSEHSGRIVQTSNILESYKGEVKAGDYLYTIDIGEGKARLAEAELEVKRAKADYEYMENNYNQQINELDVRIANEASDSNRSVLLCEKTILESQRELTMMGYRDRLDAVTAEYERISTGNDGSGLIAIYAEHDGVIKDNKVGVGGYIDAGESTFDIVYTGGDMYRVTMTGVRDAAFYQRLDDIADVGETLTLVVGGDAYKGKCVGYFEKPNATYIKSTPDGVVSSKNAESLYHFSCYMKLDNQEDAANIGPANITFPYLNMKNVITIPATYVNKTAEEYGYSIGNVWIVVGDQLIKQEIHYIESYVDKVGGMVLVLDGISEGDHLAKSQKE